MRESEGEREKRDGGEGWRRVIVNRERRIGCTQLRKSEGLYAAIQSV